MEKDICCSSGPCGALDTLAVVSQLIPATYHTALCVYVLGRSIGIFHVKMHEDQLWSGLDKNSLKFRAKTFYCW